MRKTMRGFSTSMTEPRMQRNYLYAVISVEVISDQSCRGENVIGLDGFIPEGVILGQVSKLSPETEKSCVRNSCMTLA